MSKFDGVFINDDLKDPTGDFVKDYMFHLLKETPFLDYKLLISVEKNSDFPKFVKDALAFANYGGGFILLGMQENEYLDPDIKGKFLPVGLSHSFHIDQATLQQKTNSYVDHPIELDYDEFYKVVESQKRKFAIIYIRPSREIVKGLKDGIYVDGGGKTSTAFKKDTIYTRRGTQSIPASALEIDWIKNRIKEEDYRISIISGEPDKITEPIYSNLFEVKVFPERIYLGAPLFFNRDEMVTELKKYISYPFEKYRLCENKLVTLQNLTDSSNPYSHLVKQDEITSESINMWLENKDKRNILISLLNKEIVGKGLQQGMRYHKKTEKLFFPSENQKRLMSWPSKFRASRRTVANPLYASQLKATVILHPAIRTSIIDIRDKFFLQLNPTFIITTNGTQVISGLKEGTIITKLSYNKYNDAQMNNILFWINKLGDGEDVKILDSFVISADPVQSSTEYGISWDLPTTELKTMIENYKPEIEDDDIGEEISDEFMV